MNFIERHVVQYLRAARLELSRGSFQPKTTVQHLPDVDDLPGSSADLIVFACADPVYWSRFGPGFASSLARNVKNPWLHVHLFDFHGSEPQAVEAIAKRHPDMRITWTGEDCLAPEFEQSSPAPAKQSWTSLYICCTRFLAARRLLRLYRKPLLLLDIDTIINGDVNAFFLGDKDCDYALMPRLEKWNLCKRTLGGTVYVSDTPTGNLFLDTACTYIERFLANQKFWYVFDQYALYRALLKLKRVQGRKGFRPLTERDVSFTLSPDALILYPKGTTKFDSEYAALIGSYLQRDDLASDSPAATAKAPERG